jgi:hypothetical protein
MKTPLRLVVLAALVLTESALGADAKVTITVENHTTYYLIEINRATDEEIDWSGNLLGKSVSIRPDRDQDLTMAPGYTWLRAVFDVDGTAVEVLETAEFEDGGEYVWTITEDMLWEAYDAVVGDDTYGYYDDTYGYYDDTYGYY